MEDQENKRGLSASVLKTVALITMFIDHLGCTLIFEMDNKGMFSFLYSDPRTSGAVYSWFRIVGRMAFVIFAFLLAQGVCRTSDKRRYALRLLIGALISEIPFDLMGEGRIVDIWAQNVFFTLFIGFCTVWALDTVIARGREENRRAAAAVMGIATVLLGMLAAEIVRCDYGSLGVGLIVVFYLFREHKVLRFVVGLLQYFFGYVIHAYPFALINYSRSMHSLKKGYEAFCSAIWINTRVYVEYLLPNMLGVIAALILIMFYNGIKGKQLAKRFYYLFYPVHMLVLYAALRLFIHFVYR